MKRMTIAPLIMMMCLGIIAPRACRGYEFVFAGGWLSEKAASAAPASIGNMVDMAFAAQMQSRDRCPYTWTSHLAHQCPTSAVMLVERRYGLDIPGWYLSKCAPAGCLHVPGATKEGGILGPREHGEEVDETAMLRAALEAEVAELAKSKPGTTFEEHLSEMRKTYVKDEKRIRRAVKLIMQETAPHNRDYAAINFLVEEAAYKGIDGAMICKAKEALERQLTRERALTTIRVAPRLITAGAKRSFFHGQRRIKRTALNKARVSIEAQREINAKAEEDIGTAMRSDEVDFRDRIASMGKELETQRQETAAAWQRATVATDKAIESEADLRRLRAEVDVEDAKRMEQTFTLQGNVVALEQELAECQAELESAEDHVAAESRTRMALERAIDSLQRQIAQTQDDVSNYRGMALARLQEMEDIRRGNKELAKWVLACRAKAVELEEAVEKANMDKWEDVVAPWGIVCPREPRNEA